MRTTAVRTRIRWLAGVALVLYWLSMFTGTHIPVAAEVVLNTNDKLLHFSGFFGLAFLLELVLLRSRPISYGRFFAAIGILAAYGAFDEITQTLVGRDCDVRDWLADISGATCGALLGVAAVLVWRRFWPEERAADANELSQPEATETRT
jgi:VanZ family protein